MEGHRENDSKIDAQNFTNSIETEPTATTITLSKIIESLDGPINEEQSWAMIYQLISCIQRLELDSQRENDLHLHLVTQMNHIHITELGTIAKETFLEHDGCRIKSSISNESTIISNLGLVMFLALDYGLPQNEERKISSELERLLDSMTSADDETLISFQEILHICTEHCAEFSNGNPEAFYTAILKSYAHEGILLAKFLQVVSTNEDINIQRLESSNRIRSWKSEPRLVGLSPELNQWAKSWKHVVNAIREDKIQLKKVTQEKIPPKYEPTPYENLMNQIKNGRYRLKKTVTSSGPIKVKTPHDEIMDYIRSKPKLRNVAERILSPLRKPSLTPIEKLLESIKEEHILIPVGKGKGKPSYKLKKPTPATSNNPILS